MVSSISLYTIYLFFPVCGWGPKNVMIQMPPPPIHFKVHVIQKVNKFFYANELLFRDSSFSATLLQL